jgi:hypothetical protein
MEKGECVANVLPMSQRQKKREGGMEREGERERKRERDIFASTHTRFIVCTSPWPSMHIHVCMRASTWAGACGCARV